jgi:hypothetical protein
MANHYFSMQAKQITPEKLYDFDTTMSHNYHGNGTVADFFASSSLGEFSISTVLDFEEANIARAKTAMNLKALFAEWRTQAGIASEQREPHISEEGEI